MSRLCTYFAFLVGCLAATLAQAQQTHVTNKVLQGAPFFVQIDLQQPAWLVTGEFLGHEIPFEINGPRATSLLGVDFRKPPGTYYLKVAVLPQDSTIEPHFERIAIEVIKRPTKLESFTVSARMARPSSVDRERIARERAIAKQAVRELNRKRHWQGRFARPVLGKTTSAFATRRIQNGRPRSPHAGTDFRGAVGTPIYAPNLGRVALAQDFFLSGGTVILDHGLGLFTVYMHLSKTLVKEGELVLPKQQIGDVGSTGRVTGPHLHWEARLNGQTIDPMALLTLSQEL